MQTCESIDVERKIINLKTDTNMKNKTLYNHLIHTFASVLLVVVLLGCKNNPENYTQKKIGVIRDANVVPTSFNEQIKVQIKTDNQFFIIGTNYKMPQLTLGDSLVGLFSGSMLKYIIDSRGEKYKVR